MISILKGVRPGKPTFDTTRGYTKELWEMTTSCWKEDAGDRPTVDYVLDALRSAAGQWESNHGEGSTQPPSDCRSSTFTESDSDKAVDRILVRAKLPLGEGGVRKAVETLGKVSARMCLLPTYRCAQPADDRCWNPLTG